MKETENFKIFSGWLFLLGISLILGFFAHLYQAYESFTVFTDGTVELLSDKSSDLYTPGFNTLLRIELAVLLINLSIITYLFFLFINKSIYFPNVFVVSNILFIITTMVEFIALQSYEYFEILKDIMTVTLHENRKYILFNILGSILWILYIINSKRVKLTFVYKVY